MNRRTLEEIVLLVARRRGYVFEPCLRPSKHFVLEGWLSRDTSPYPVLITITKQEWARARTTDRRAAVVHDALVIAEAQTRRLESELLGVERWP